MSVDDTGTGRASFDELLEFANKVRAAGGGNPLDALMPAVPQNASACLIAKNLNFNCEVGGLGSGHWGMFVDDNLLAEKIATELGLRWEPARSSLGQATIELPDAIGQVAHDFDRAQEILSDMLHVQEYPDNFYKPTITDEDRQLVQEMWPYIEASVQEAYGNATQVNDDGSITL